jgi:ribosome recycling factor
MNKNKSSGAKINKNVFVNHPVFGKILSDFEKRITFCFQKMEEELLSFQVTKINLGYIGNIHIASANTKVSDLANLSLENRTFTLIVHDKTKISQVSKSIENERNLVVSQGNEKNILKISIPDPTEEQRTRVAKEMRSACEKYIQQVNNIRTEVLKECDKLEKAQKDAKKKKDAASSLGISDDEIKMFINLVNQTKDEKIQLMENLLNKQEKDIKDGKK